VWYECNQFGWNVWRCWTSKENMSKLYQILCGWWDVENWSWQEAEHLPFRYCSFCVQRVDSVQNHRLPVFDTSLYWCSIPGNSIYCHVLGRWLQLYVSLWVGSTAETYLSMFWSVAWLLWASDGNTREPDFGTWKVYCVSNVTFHAEFKYAKICKTFPSPTVFAEWHFLLLIFWNFGYFLQWFFIREPVF
jgi:hypothetical protein